MSTQADEVIEALRQAQDAVERAGIADDLREAAFAAAFGQFTGASTPAGASDTTGSISAGARSGGVGVDVSGLGRLATAIGVTPDALSYIYEMDGDDLRLVIPRTLLPDSRSRAAAMRHVAQ